MKNITNKRKSSLDRYIYRLDAVEERFSKAEIVRGNIQAKSQGVKEKENTEGRVKALEKLREVPARACLEYGAERGENGAEVTFEKIMAADIQASLQHAPRTLRKLIGRKQHSGTVFVHSGCWKDTP